MLGTRYLKNLAILHGLTRREIDTKPRTQRTSMLIKPPPVSLTGNIACSQALPPHYRVLAFLRRNRRKVCYRRQLSGEVNWHECVTLDTLTIFLSRHRTRCETEHPRGKAANLLEKIPNRLENRELSGLLRFSGRKILDPWASDHDLAEKP